MATLSGHSQEVCGLRWAPDGRHLASGGNDNLVNVWPSAPGEGGWVPLQTFTQHQGAVKVRVGSTVYGIFQTRILEWVTFPFSGGVFPIQGLKLGLICYRQILYH